MESNIVYCSCGYGEGKKHLISSGNCCREIVPPDEEPHSYREEKLIYSSVANGKREVISKVYTVSKETVTEYVLLNQRMYYFDETTKIWTRPKNKESSISLVENW
jgi:gamma-glutamylcyclotransferase (GGCT)/AIG2-like uncharacterized protein YtfP